MPDMHVVLVTIDGATTAHGPYVDQPGAALDFAQLMRGRLVAPNRVQVAPVCPPDLAGVREAHPDALI